MHRPHRLVSLVYAILVIVPVACSSASDAAPEQPPAKAASGVYTEGPRSYDGTGRYYMGREISEVMGHLGASWLERPERVREERTDLVVEAFELKPDAVVADIGAGTGYFSFRVAKVVPEGKVYAVDIQPEMLAIVTERMAERGVTNVEPVRGAIDDPRLPAGQVDLAFMVDVYHEFSHPKEMMERLRASLRPGGRVVLLEYREEDPDVPIKPRHKMSQAQVKKELEAVGFRWLETKDFLPRQHFLVFEKPRE